LSFLQEMIPTFSTQSDLDSKAQAWNGNIWNTYTFELQSM